MVNARRLTTAFAAVIVLNSSAALAQELEVVPYAWLEQQTQSKIDFEDFEDFAFSGVEVPLDGLYAVDGAVFGERFEGQVLSRGEVGSNLANFDVISGVPSSPLSIVSGRQDQNLSLLRLRTGAVSLYPESWVGYPDVSSGGEGAVSILFDVGQVGFGFLVSATSAADNYDLGMLQVSCFDGAGVSLGELGVQLQVRGGFEGVAFVLSNARADIMGCTIQNNDPKGVGFDGFIFGFDGALTS